MSAILDILEIRDMVIEGKHAVMMKEIARITSLKNIDIFIMAWKLGIIDNKRSELDVDKDEYVSIPRTVIKRNESEIEKLLNATALFLLDGDDSRDKIKNYTKINESHELALDYRAKVMEVVRGGIEELYDLIQGRVDKNEYIDIEVLFQEQ